MSLVPRLWCLGVCGASGVYDVCGVYGVLVSVVPLVCMMSVVSMVSWCLWCLWCVWCLWCLGCPGLRGVARNLAMGGQNFYRKPHLLSNAKTGSNYFSVRVPAIHILSNNNEHVDELGVTVKSLEPATLLAGASQPSHTN